jgi:phosphatidylglycerophosphate synthase
MGCSISFLAFHRLLDGYSARKLGGSSKFDSYFDAMTDFIFVFSMFTAFTAERFCPDWVLPLIIAAFVQFLLISLYSKKMYDPVRKYYGSLLYGAIGLRFILSGKSFTTLLQWASWSAR